MGRHKPPVITSLDARSGREGVGEMRKWIVRILAIVMIAVASVGFVFVVGVLVKLLIIAFLMGWSAISL